MAGSLVVKEVDGKKYEFEQFNARHGLKIFTRLVKLLGEPMVMAMSAAGIGGKGMKGVKLGDREINKELMAKAANSLAERLDEDEVIDLIESLIGETAATCNGRKIIFADHYAGNFGHMFKVLASALEVQYGNFFAERLASLGSAPSTSSPENPA